ncbi:DUF6574 domain-containing protein [Bifidobacterium tibiigranuli]|uniref:DUF6574 domain-containing protein n=1 Tax=Bifidobacterium tibiigranuli TaxID=2172043 RepID=UPI0026ECDB25|nr:DUF6574 domain-containing protein [Bifidobacterium tibiigranuli]MCI1650438.1 hypothetical protein [Bifidobacterium tibiigranuli]MCI2185992.1 hypothetical protein [Bifidobacterium tibiigranuli]MCI2204037.1 hypothetical protein [Bifidobacterium tibiigranuli]
MDQRIEEDAHKEAKGSRRSQGDADTESAQLRIAPADSALGTSALGESATNAGATSADAADNAAPRGLGAWLASSLKAPSRDMRESDRSIFGWLAIVVTSIFGALIPATMAWRAISAFAAYATNRAGSLQALVLGYVDQGISSARDALPSGSLAMPFDFAASYLTTMLSDKLDAVQASFGGRVDRWESTLRSNITSIFVVAALGFLIFNIVLVLCVWMVRRALLHDTTFTLGRALNLVARQYVLVLLVLLAAELFALLDLPIPVVILLLVAIILTQMIVRFGVFDASNRRRADGYYLKVFGFIVANILLLAVFALIVVFGWHILSTSL